MADETEAAAAFDTLSDPTRIRILRAFAAVMDEGEIRADTGMPVLSFSEVYDRVDVDSTSQLSYHLDELDGRYLRHTDEGWTFTFAGEAIVRVFLAGEYAGGVEFDPVEVPERCLFCDSDTVRAVVDDRILHRECADCGRAWAGAPITPAQLRDRDPEELLDSVTTRIVSQFRQYRNELCARCGGVADIEVRSVAIPAGDGAEQILATARCRRCWRMINGPVPMWLANHPTSVAFHENRGVDVLSHGVGELAARLRTGDWGTEPVDDGRYRVTYRVDDDALRLFVDETLDVVRSERVRHDSAGDRRS